MDYIHIYINNLIRDINNLIRNIDNHNYVTHIITIKNIYINNINTNNE